MTTPLFVVSSCALFVGALAAIFIIVAVATDHWQSYTYDGDSLSFIKNKKQSLRIVVDPRNDSIYVVQIGKRKKVYLIPEHSGIWRKCFSIPESTAEKLMKDGHIKGRCFNFVREFQEEDPNLKISGNVFSKMQTSEAACFIVTLIDLLAAKGIGIIGITQKQVSVCMVTGVLYMMSGLFGIFGLTIFHTKDVYERNCSYMMKDLPSELCPALRITKGHAISLAWVGIVLCVIACCVWIFLARALRVIKSKTML